MSDSPYNPLDKINLGQSIAEALLSREALPLTAESTKSIVGAGIYAIYYEGAFEPYAPVTARNSKGEIATPIYVGKAIPKGGRKGGIREVVAEGRSLRGRLNKHARSIAQAENLSLGDFTFRSLVVDDIWIPLGENILIEIYKPIWNLVIEGFGINAPGKGRAAQNASMWDVLHEGRPYARDLSENPLTADAIVLKLKRFFAGELSESELLEVEGSQDETEI